jgi:hypothetical protein
MSEGDGADTRPVGAGEIVPRDQASETLTIRDIEMMLRERGCSNRKAKVGASAAFNAMSSASDVPADPPPDDEPVDQLLSNALARLRGG